MLAAQIFGMALIFCGTVVFIMNILMLALFLSKGLISVKHDCVMIYRLIFNFIICDTVQVTPMIYIGFCSVLQTSLVPDVFDGIAGTICIWMWFEMVFMLIIMAVNRYIAVCHFNKYASIFTTKNVAIIIVLSWLISGIATMIDQYVFSCCAMVTFYPIFTLMYRNPNGQENLASKYDPHTNEISLVILLFCYIKIFLALRKSAQQFASSMTPAAQHNRTRRNIRFVIQCLFASTFYVLMFVFYNFFPKFLPQGVLLPYSAIAFFTVAHCSVNSITCLVFNLEIRQMSKQILCCHKATASSSGTQILHRSQGKIILAPI